MTKRKMTMTPDMTKAVNKRVVLAYLLKHTPTSRAGIARGLQLSKPTVSAIVAELIQEGLAREVGFKQSGLGRPWVEIELAPSSRFAVGIEVDVAEARLIVTDILSRPAEGFPPLIQAAIDTATPERAALSLSEVIESVVTGHRRRLGSGHGAAAPRLVGIGIGVPAVVNSQTREIVGSNPLNWSGPAPFGAIVQEHAPAPVLVTQRVMAAAWAERMFGRGREAHSLVYARFGSGVATGIVLNDQIYVGSTDFAGDIANMTFLPHGITGGLEQPLALGGLVTRDALVTRARQLLLEGVYTASSALDAAGGEPSRITLDLLCDGALRNDPLCRKVIVEAGRYVGVAIANVIGILNPPLVVLGGPLTQAGSVLLEAVRDQVKRCCNRYAYSSVHIYTSELGDLAPALGAASLPDMRSPLVA